MLKRYEKPYQMPYDITPDTKYFWETFKRQTELGNAIAAIIAYCEFFKERLKVYTNLIIRRLKPILKDLTTEYRRSDIRKIRKTKQRDVEFSC